MTGFFLLHATEISVHLVAYIGLDLRQFGHAIPAQPGSFFGVNIEEAEIAKATVVQVAFYVVGHLAGGNSCPGDDGG